MEEIDARAAASPEKPAEQKGKRKRRTAPGAWWRWPVLLMLAQYPVLLLDAIFDFGLGGRSRVTPAMRDRSMLNTIVSGMERLLEENPGPGFTPGTPTADGEDSDADTSAGSGLVALIAGRGLGPERDVLDKIRKAEAAPDLPSGWKGGLTPDLAIYDAWGGVFRVRVDLDNDGQVTNPRPTAAATGKPRLRRRVLVWTAGKDGNWDTWEDNVMSR